MAAYNGETNNTGSGEASAVITNDDLVNVLNDLASQHAAMPGYTQGTHIVKVAPPPALLASTPPSQEQGVTNTGEPKIQVTNLSLPDSRKAMSDLQGKMTTITAITDPLDRVKALDTFKSDFAAFQANTKKEHLDTAYAENGVPILQNQLRESQRTDRMQPREYAIYGDSSITRKIQSQLDAATARAEATANKTLGTDATLASVMSTADSFYNREHTLADGEIKKTDNVVNQADYTLGQYNNKTLEWTTRIIPDAAKNDPTGSKLKIAAMSILNGKQNKEAAQVFDMNTTEADLPKLAMTGNSYASVLTSQLQSEATGQPIREVQQQLRDFQLATTNDNAFAQKLKENPSLLLNPSTKAVYDHYQKIVLAGSDAEKKKIPELRAEILGGIAVLDAQRRLSNDVESWSVSPNKQTLQQDPQIADAIATLKRTHNGQPVNITELSKVYLNSLPDEQKADGLAKLKAIYSDAIDKQNAGLYGKVNKVAMLSQLDAQGAIFQFLDKALGQIGVSSYGDPAFPQGNPFIGR